MLKSLIKIILILLAMLPFGTKLKAAEIRVPENYKTITEAVANSVPNDVILVNDGIYNENLIISAPLSLKALKGPESTIINANDKSKHSITVFKTTDVAITGFSITGSEKSGIFVSNSSNVTLTNNKTLYNNIGITLSHSINNTLKENEANHNIGYGIYLDNSNGNLIESNSASRNEDKGFFVSMSNENTIINNNVNLNAWDGIMLWSSNRNIIHENRTLRNTYGLVISESTENDVADNTTLPNIFIIMPIILLYLGIISYWVQKNILRLIYK